MCHINKYKIQAISALWRVTINKTEPAPPSLPWGRYFIATCSVNKTFNAAKKLHPPPPPIFRPTPLPPPRLV